MNIEKEVSKPIFKATLLAISLFIMMPSVISPALPLMEKAFPNIPRVTVELLTTIPNFGEIFGLLINPFLVKKIGRKKVILIGLALVGICGTLPVIVNSFWLIFILRILLGFGIGIYNSLAVSLIMMIYENNKTELNRLLGFQNIMNDVGYIASAFIICYLVTLSWHAVFWVYILAITVFFMFEHFIKVPKKTKHSSGKHFSLSNIKQSFNSNIIYLSILTLLIYIFYMALAYKLPSFIVDFHLGNESMASLMLAVIAITGIPCGIAFNWLYTKLNKWVWVLCMILNALGFYLTSSARNTYVLVAGCIVLGAGFGIVMPYIFKSISLSVPDKLSNLATTLCLIMMDIGAVISPFVISIIAKNSDKALLSSAIFFGIVTLIEVARNMYANLKHKY